MITANSRYANSPVGIVDDSVRGQVQVITSVDPYEGTSNFTYYQIEDFDTIDWIALTVLGDGRFWWKIADVNPDAGFDWTHLTPGTIIRIPSA